MSQPQSTDLQFDPKNRLQQFVQRAGMQLPVYQTYNEVNQHPHLAHMPQFRSRLWIDGTMYISPIASSSKKAAERSVAELAFVNVLEKVKNEGRAYVSQDTMLSKQIVNEYAKKINVEAPEYTTSPSNTIIPIFISSLSLNGATFTGVPGKTKKDAEQSAARAAILSILESETGVNTMLVLVKSKFKHYQDLLQQVKDSSTGQEQCMDALPGPEPSLVSAQPVHFEDPNPVSSLKRIRAEPLEATSLVPCPVQPELSTATTPESSAEPLLLLTLGSTASTTNQISQPIPQPLHVFNIAKPAQTSVTEIITPIEFVPATAIALSPLLSTSAKKRRNCKSKKKRERAQRQAEAKPAQTSVVEITTPIEFVPATAEALAPLLSTSAKKRKNKKKRKRAHQAALTAGTLPPNPISACKA